MSTPLEKVRRAFAAVKQERRSWEPGWREYQSFIEPARGRFLASPSASEVNNGARLCEDKRVNSEASRALSILASGIQSGLTSKARQWFLLAHPDPDVNRYQPVRAWYDKVQEVLEGIYRRSNIYASLLHTYKEMAAFGTGAMAVFAHPDKTIYCRPFTTGTYYLSLDQWFEVDAFYYVEYLTAHQLDLQYGKDKLPSHIVSDLENQRSERRYEVVNALFRHPEKYGIPVKEGFGVGSVHFLANAGDHADSFLRVNHYKTWPVMTPRWDVIDADVYGRPPAADVINDVKMMQRMETDCLKGIAKGVNPPMRIPPELDRRGLNMQPGGLNVVSNMNEHAVAPLVTVVTNIQQLQMKIDRVIEGIKDGFYNSLFLALLTQNNPQMTAREVAERHEEKLLMLGPVLERIHYELLDPLIARTFHIALEAGLIPPPPDDIDLSDTEVEYVSILSQAQKAVGVNRIEQSAAFLGSLVSVYPEVRHALDPYKAFKEYNQMIGVRADIFRSDDEYARAVDAEKKQQQLAEGAEVVEPLANSAKIMSETDPANVRQLLSGQFGGPVI